jgi:glycosyl transferase family 25
MPKLPVSPLDETASSPWSRCGVFLINLDRSPERLQLAHQSLAAAQVPYQRIAGFDASLEDLSLCRIDAKSFQTTHGRTEPRKGEIGCFQSHVRAMEAFLATDKETAIIMEDDAVPEPWFESGVAQLLAWRQAWDIAPLFHFHNGGPIKIRKSDAFNLTIFLTHVSSSAAYILNRKAALKLLEHMSTQRACVDHALFEKYTHGLRLRGISPMPMRLSSQANISTIGVEKSGKLPFFKRFPTFVHRSVSALKIFGHALRELRRERFQSGL